MKKITGMTGILLGSLAMSATALAEETAGGGFIDTVANVNNAVNGVVWGVPALAQPAGPASRYGHSPQITCCAS